MLADATDWGMHLVNVSRGEYRRRNDPEYLEDVQQRFAPCLVIPEGGSNAAGARGCMAIATLVQELVPPPARVVLAVGTGTTLAGVAAGLGGAYEVIGISALKGATDLEGRVEKALGFCDQAQPATWSILHEEHCGGFARVSEELREFILAFESVHGVELDPVYTGKVLFAIYRRLQRGEWGWEEPLLAIHTGGLQGRRGFPWLGNL